MERCFFVMRSLLSQPIRCIAPRLLLILAICVVDAPDFGAKPRLLANHPFHVATAETRWNLDTKKLEVSIRCHPIDLENALRRRTGKKIDLDTTENIDQLLADYLRDTFQIHQSPNPGEAIPSVPSASRSSASPSSDPLTNPPNNPSNSVPHPSPPASSTLPESDSRPAKLHWVGKEIDLKWAWLYIELEPKDLQQKLYMTNTILMDVLDDQSNTVIIRLGTERQSLIFLQKKRTLPFPRPSDFVKQAE